MRTRQGLKCLNWKRIVKPYSARVHADDEYAKRWKPSNDILNSGYLRTEDLKHYTAETVVLQNYSLHKLEMRKTQNLMTSSLIAIQGI